MFTSYDLRKRIADEGKENIRFIVPMKQTGILTPLGVMISSSDPDVPTICKITEERYKVEDNYKISLTPANFQGYTEHFYQEDLSSLIEKGIVKIVENSKDRSESSIDQELT